MSTRKQPGYLRRTDDPIAFIACRDRRMTAPSDKEFTRAVLELRVCSPILADVFGLGVLRKHLWRALRGTPVGDELESRGMDEVPADGHLFVTVGEIVGTAMPPPSRTGRIGDAFLEAMMQRPRSRWDQRTWGTEKQAPDAVLLERDAAWKSKLRGTKIGRSIQPCLQPRRSACEIVEGVAVLVSWELRTRDGHDYAHRALYACGSLAGACRFAGADVTATDVLDAIKARFAALNGCWKRGEPIVRVGETTIAGNMDRAQTSLFDER